MKTAKIILALLISVNTMAQLKYPVTNKVNVVDNYFGTEVKDPYRWFEKGDSAGVTQWVEAQNAVTAEYLKKIPYRDAMRKRLEEIWNYPRTSTPLKRGNRYFFFKNNGLQNQSVLYTFKKGQTDADAEVLLDPNTFSAEGTTSLGNFDISKDGKYIAYSVSKAGSDWNTIYVMEIETKTKLPDEINWVKFSGISWYKNGFYYSRYDAPADNAALQQKNEYHKVYFHKVRTMQDSDELVHEDKARPMRNFSMEVTEDETYLIMYASEGASSKNMLFCKEIKSKGDFTPIVTEVRARFNVIDNIGSKLLVLTNDKAPKAKLVLIDPKMPEPEKWTTVIAENKEVLNNIILSNNKIIASYSKNACSQLKVFGMDGKYENEIKLPALGTIDAISGKKNDKELLYGFSSFTFPTTIYSYDFATQKSVLYKKSELKFKSDQYETKQVFYPSKDGTKVSMFIVHKKGLVLNGQNPTLLYGYGGFNISVTPNFSISRLLLLENNGVLAVTNLRGGSEYGEEWHTGGMLFNKQNVFDDFAAAAEYLIEQKYTSASYLAASGRSNGGLLVGATINQRPDLFKVAFPAVGVMDMLRYHKFTIGWAWVAEYGSSDNEEQFKYIYKYSPVHNISESINYPAVMVQTADHDDRVVPAHSYKYIATLQEKYRGTNPVIIRIEVNAGHGAGKPTSMQIDDAVDMWAFMFYNMGITPKQ